MKERESNGLLGWVLIALVLSYAGVLLLAPLAAIVTGAFRDGLAPILEDLATPDAVSALWLTARLAVSAALTNAVLGLLAAWVLVRHSFPGRRILNALVDMPFVISPVIVGYVMIVLFGRGGWLTDFPIKLAFSVEAMFVVTVFVSLPFVIRELQPVLAGLAPEHEEAAYTLGASRWLTFRRVLFPMLRHALTVGAMLALARALGEFGAAAIIGGAVEGSTETATIFINRVMLDRNPSAAYAMSLLLGGFAVVLLLIMNFVRRSGGSSHVHSH
jgi:sulfate transport system permease protein